MKLSARRLVFLVGVPSFVMLLATGCSREPQPATAEEEISSAPVKAVAGQIVSLGEFTELVGTTVPLPNQFARVTAAVEGRVFSVLGNGQVKPLIEGQHVDKGSEIVQLDDRVARANRDKLKAMVDDMDEQKKQADLAEKLALLDLDRLQKLRPANTADESLPLVSRIEIEKARVALADSQSKQRALLARQRGLRAEAQALDLQVDYHKLRAPISGWLGQVQVVPGQTLTVGTQVAEITNLDEIDLLCVAPPHVVRRLVVGQPAWINPRGGPTASDVHGRVEFIAVQAQPDTGNFFSKVRFSNKNLGLRANMVVRARVQTQPDKERFVIPEAALQEDQVPPAVIVAWDVTTKKNAAGAEQKWGKARRLIANLGVRDRDRHLVEILRLEDPDKKEAVPFQNLPFVIEGGHGLQNDDVLKIDELSK